MKKYAIIAAAVFGMSFTAPNGEFEGKSDGNFHKRFHFNQSFKAGEILEYRVHYGFVDAGIARLEVKPQTKKINGKDVLHIVGTGESVGAFDWFYKVRDRYESFIDPEKMQPLVFVRRVNEGGFIINHDYVFHHNKNQVFNGKKMDDVPTNVQDVVSAFYYSRTMDLSKMKVNDIITIYSYLDHEVYPLKIKYKGIENVKIKSGTYECMRFVPVVQKGRVFKTEDDLSIWVTNDKARIPVLAKANIIVGSVKMELTKYENAPSVIAKL
jgi:hypothetical protein